MTEEHKASQEAEYAVLVRISEQLVKVLQSEAHKHTHRSEEELTDEYCRAAVDEMAPQLLEIMRPEAVGLADIVIGVGTLLMALRDGHTVTLQYDETKMYSACANGSVVSFERIADLLVVGMTALITGKTTDEEENPEEPHGDRASGGE